LILGEVLVGTRLSWVVAELGRSNVLDAADKTAFEAVVDRAVAGGAQSPTSSWRF
jgi:hypothetical protein